MMDIKTRAISGLKWSAISQIGRLGTQLLTTVILAHLLPPSDFGLVAMAMVVIGFVGVFKDLGSSAAVIQWKNPSDALFSTIFWINAGFGAVATVVLFFLAPLVGLFYHEPRVVDIIKVLSISFLISGPGILHQALLERALSFNSLARLEITSLIIGAMAGIGLAFGNAGVWSLVFQTLVTVSMTTLLLWLSNSWRPKFLFHLNEVKDVSSFSLNLTGFSIFNYFARNADYLLIGLYLGAQDLGYYTFAYRILLFPLQSISAVISRVLYPVLSGVQDDNKRFASAYLKITGSIAFVTFPLMAGVWALAEPVTLALFGEQWRPVIILIIILAPVGLIQSIGTTVGLIYQAKGRTDLMFRWGIGAGTLTIIAFMIGLNWGISGVAIAYAITSFILLYPGFSIPFRLIDLNFVQMLRILRPSFLNCSLMFMSLAAIKIILPGSLPAAFVLVVSVILGVAVYLSASWITNRGQLVELWSLTGLGRKKSYAAG